MTLKQQAYRILNNCFTKYYFMRINQISYSKYLVSIVVSISKHKNDNLIGIINIFVIMWISLIMER